MVNSSSAGKFFVLNSLILLLNTAGGVKDGRECFFVGKEDFISLQAGQPIKDSAIICSDGTVISPVYGEKVSATGTPPHLMFTNYVGAYYLKNEDMAMPGAARRYIFFAGEPALKKD